MKSKSENPTVFSQRLRALRRAAGMTQQEVAEHLGIQRSTYSYYETGAIEPSLPTLQRIAAEYRVTTGYLLGDVGGEGSLTMHQDASNPLEGAELMSSCTREERKFLSLLRRMSESERKQLQEIGLSMLLSSAADATEGDLAESFERHVHPIAEILPREE